MLPVLATALSPPPQQLSLERRGTELGEGGLAFLADYPKKGGLLYGNPIQQAVFFVNYSKLDAPTIEYITSKLGCLMMFKTVNQKQFLLERTGLDE